MVRLGSEDRIDGKLTRRLAMSLTLMWAMMTTASAQGPVWSDIACGESRLMIAEGFHCRATEPYTPGGGSHATYRFYTAAMTTAEATTFLYLMEGLDEQSWIRFSLTLPEQLSQSIPLARSGRDWSAVRLNTGSGYALFTSDAGERCVGFRKPGPDRGAGHAWAILGIRCAQKEQALSDTDIVDAIEAARTK